MKILSLTRNKKFHGFLLIFVILLISCKKKSVEEKTYRIPENLKKIMVYHTGQVVKFKSDSSDTIIISCNRIEGINSYSPLGVSNVPFEEINISFNRLDSLEYWKKIGFTRDLGTYFNITGRDFLIQLNLPQEYMFYSEYLIKNKKFFSVYVINPEISAVHSNLSKEIYLLNENGIVAFTSKNKTLLFTPL